MSGFIEPITRNPHVQLDGSSTSKGGNLAVGVEEVRDGVEPNALDVDARGEGEVGREFAEAADAG
jgi:hypothetical protein